MEKKLGIEFVKNERLRQINEEGYSWMHDDQWTASQLSDAAIVYATPAPLRHEIMHKWPWDEKYFKPDKTHTYDGRIRELTKAGALICAEIDRLIRLNQELEGDMEERKIGEVFNYEGVRLQVKEADNEHFCLGCYFNRNSHCYKPYDGVGTCIVGKTRVNIIFREVKE